jgi:hypothetical protein
MALESDPFDVQVERWVRKAGTLARAAFQETAQLALGRVKDLTPVDTGFLRANWTVIKQGDAMPVAGDVRAADSLGAIEKARLGDKLLLVNPVVYAARVNYGFVGTDSLGRHYDQKGRHMLEQTISELPQMAKLAVQIVRRDGGFEGSSS